MTIPGITVRRPVTILRDPNFLFGTWLTDPMFNLGLMGSREASAAGLSDDVANAHGWLGTIFGYYGISVRCWSCNSVIVLVKRIKHRAVRQAHDDKYDRLGIETYSPEEDEWEAERELLPSEWMVIPRSTSNHDHDPRHRFPDHFPTWNALDVNGGDVLEFTCFNCESPQQSLRAVRLYEKAWDAVLFAAVNDEWVEQLLKSDDHRSIDAVITEFATHIDVRFERP